MHLCALLTALLAGAAAVVDASRFGADHVRWRRGGDASSEKSPNSAAPGRADSNPFTHKKLAVNPRYAAKLDPVYDAFANRSDQVNAAKVQAIQGTGGFFWISNIASLGDVDLAIASARHARKATGLDQIVGLVVYNVPDRDCGAGESSGELKSDENGLERYKWEYITPLAWKLGAAADVTFAVIVEPDAVGNIVTNGDEGLCSRAVPVYEEAISFAISSLQLDNVHLYLDASNGGWLGWDSTMQSVAKEFSKIVGMAKPGARGSRRHKIRGFSTNVSNFNPFRADAPPDYAGGSPSYDESRFARNLARHLGGCGLPARFIVDQSRVGLPGARRDWGEWCNVAPAGFGAPPGTPLADDNDLVDSIVWVKPGGESDGRCGRRGAPPAGQWFHDYAEMLVENAHPLVKV